MICKKPGLAPGFFFGGFAKRQTEARVLKTLPKMPGAFGV
jgi:hypothetical protein